MPLARIRLKLAPKVRRLAPLEPDAFLRWWWRYLPKRDRSARPATVEDIWFELVRADPERTLEETRRDYLHLAARVRRNQRLGLEPLDGIL